MILKSSNLLLIHIANYRDKNKLPFIRFNMVFFQFNKVLEGKIRFLPLKCVYIFLRKLLLNMKSPWRQGNSIQKTNVYVETLSLSKISVDLSILNAFSSFQFGDKNAKCNSEIAPQMLLELVLEVFMGKKKLF